MTRKTVLVVVLVAILSTLFVSTVGATDPYVNGVLSSGYSLDNTTHRTNILRWLGKNTGLDASGITGADVDLYMAAVPLKTTSGQFLSYHYSCAPDTNVRGVVPAEVRSYGVITSTGTAIVNWVGSQGAFRYLCNQ
ncbi:MAG: hypothetical protein ACOYLB_01460 [Phototrophicaceae bacterium]